MANEKNLKPQAHKLTVEEAKKGGRNSGKARKEKKAFKELAETILSAKMNDKEYKAFAKAFGVENPDNKEMVVIGMVRAAINGNHHAYDRLMALCGEDAPLNNQQEEEHNGLIEAIKKRNETD